MGKTYLLWNDSQSTPEVLQVKGTSLYPIYLDAAPFLCLDEAEEGEKEGGFPASCPSYHLVCCGGWVGGWVGG